MDATGWAAVAASASAIAAIVSLDVAWQAKRIQGNSTDFGNCLQVLGQLRDAMRRVHDATEADKQKFEFIELLNLMEALALLDNASKLSTSTKKFTEKFLIEASAWIKSSEDMTKLRRESITGDNTFYELQTFEHRHAHEINNLCQSTPMEFK